MERSVSLQADFSPAGELLYICYMATGNRSAAISLLEKVCDYNPVCYYSFYYLGLEQMRSKRAEAVDSIQNAIRLYYAAYGRLAKLMKPDYPELSKDLLLAVFGKLSKEPVTKLHPCCNAAIMWLHLCHCYMEQANFEGAYNCSNKALDDYLKYSPPTSSGKTEIPKGEFSDLVSLLSEVNKPNYAAVPRHAAIEQLLASKENAGDILTLAWSSAKVSLHLSLLKETLVYSELGLKAAMLCGSLQREMALKYAAEFVLYAMHCGCFLVEQLKASAFTSVAPHVIKYFKVWLKLTP